MAFRLYTNGTLTVDLYLELLVDGLTASVTMTIGVPVKRAIIIIGSGKKQYRNFTRIRLSTYFAVVCRHINVEVDTIPADSSCSLQWLLLPLWPSAALSLERGRLV